MGGRELPHAPAQDPTLADDPTLAEVGRPTPAKPRWADMSEGEARVRLTYLRLTHVILLLFNCVAYV